MRTTSNALAAPALKALSHLEDIAPFTDTPDDRYGIHVRRLEQVLADCGCTALTAVPYDDIKLGWSRARPSHAYPNGRWRFILLDEDGAVELLSASWEERADVVASGALTRLVHQMVVALKQTHAA